MDITSGKWLKLTRCYRISPLRLSSFRSPSRLPTHHHLAPVASSSSCQSRLPAQQATNQVPVGRSCPSILTQCSYKHPLLHLNTPALLMLSFYLQEELLNGGQQHGMPMLRVALVSRIFLRRCSDKIFLIAHPGAGKQQEN